MSPIYNKFISKLNTKFVWVILVLFLLKTNGFSQQENTLDTLCFHFPNDSLITSLCNNFKDANNSQLPILAHKADSIGMLYLKKAKYVEATHLFELTTSIWENRDSEYELSNSLIHLGRVHYRQGNIFESFQHVNEGLLLAEENKFKDLEALGHLYLSWDYWSIRQCDEALNQILQLKKLIDSEKAFKHQLGDYYNARAKFEHCLGNEQNSFTMADSAINFARTNQLRRLESVTMSNKANYLEKNGSFEEMIYLLQGAIAINRELNDKEQLGSNLGVLGQVYANHGMYQESLEKGLLSLNIAKEINDKPRMFYAHNICRKAYVAMEDFTNAYKHERDSRLLADEIYGLRHLDKVFDLQMAKSKAEQEKKIAQIASEKELQNLKISQERRIYALGFGAMGLLLVGGFFYWIGYKRNKEKETQLVKEVLENEMKELELQSLRALMNPHFIFNSLNSIKGFIIRNEPDVAANYLNKFSHLIRLILSNSQKPLISLSEELKALDMYIQLEGLRLEGKFEYSIKVENKISTDSIQVAPMIIQPFVENAIWHGLMSKKGPKILSIKISNKANGIEISIKDNGIGREVAQQRKQNFGVKKKSYGMKITENRIKFARQDNNVKVKDLVSPEGDSLGTEVVIQLNT